MVASSHHEPELTMKMPINAMPSAEPNVTPMIDVLLVLLIVFMLVAIRVHRTIDTQLPQTCASVCEGPEQFVLEILPGPSYRINQRAVPSLQLSATFEDIYRVRPEKVIEIAGHPGVRYNDVVA